MRQRFRRSQEPGSYLYCAGAQDQRRSHSAPIRNSTRGNDWHRNCVKNLGQKSHKSHHLIFRLVNVEGPAVPAGFHALSNHRVGAGRFSRPGFSNRGNRGEP